MKIIFKNDDDSIGIITPTEEALSFATIHQIAVKDVPAGLRYIVVNDDVVPTDRTFRSAWEWGFNYSDGVGGTSNEFPEEVLNGIGK